MIQYLKCFIYFFLFTIVLKSNSQNVTVGLLYNDSNVSDGYTLFTPETNEFAYLINNCGELINFWTFNEIPGATCYLLENGNLLRAGKDSLQIRDWNNNVIWTYATTDNNIAQHHDIEPLPNGNILCVTTQLVPANDIINQGRNPAFVGLNVKLDKIVELKPLGTNQAEITWEWRMFDHLIQDFDSTKLNYGNVADHIELIDINFDNNEAVDWTHVNAVDYNEDLDQILVTSRHLSELYIIDHSTTTAEAASHSGGNSNMGGDLLWRWGNPQVYRKGGLADQQLFKPHDGKWVEQGYLDYGKISVFNNGGDGISLNSSVHILAPDIIAGVYQKDSGKFLPIDFDWSWSGSILGITLMETKKSGTHALPNGNIIICESSYGRVSEITKAGDLLWSYMNPSGYSIYNQYDSVPVPFNSTFRAEKYPPNYVGFFGQNLASQGLIEDQNPNTDTCLMSINIDNAQINTINITNPVIDNIIEFNDEVQFEHIIITDINGRNVFTTLNFQGSVLNVNLHSGMYFIQLINNDNILSKKIIIP